MVGPCFDLTDVGTAACNSLQGWMLGTFTGNLHHANRRSRWEGQPEQDELKQGDVVVRLPSRPPLTV